jgi:hypothetical protein
MVIPIFTHHQVEMVYHLGLKMRHPKTDSQIEKQTVASPADVSLKSA